MPKSLEGLQLFRKLGTAITASLEFEQIFSAMQHSLEELFTTDASIFYLYDWSEKQLSIEKVHGAPLESRLHRRFSVEMGIVGEVIRSGEVSMCEDPTQDPHYSFEWDIPWVDSHKMLVCVPIRDGDRVYGAFEIGVSKNFEKWSRAEGIEILLAIADFAAVAMRNAVMTTEVRQLAVIDDVTGLHNGRYLREVLGHEISRSTRYKTVFSLIFVDIDYFKRVNDAFGHLVGSRLLGEFGQWAKRQLRDSDILARWGGDEFIIFLPHTSKEKGALVARRLCQELPSQFFLESKLVISASFGVVAFPADGKEVEELIHKSDEAMYRVKKRGRNGIELY